jgi:hypothetical protein
MKYCLILKLLFQGLRNKKLFINKKIGNMKTFSKFLAKIYSKIILVLSKNKSLFLLKFIIERFGLYRNKNFLNLQIFMTEIFLLDFN